MSKLVVCSSCLGFVNHGAAACPHCDVPQVKRTTTGAIVKSVVAAVAGLGFMSTMMACYGTPPIEDGGVNPDSGTVTDAGVNDGASTDDGITDASATDSGTAEDASIDGGG